MTLRIQSVVMVVLAVVELDGHYLVIREAKHGGGWYLPAGRVEIGENLFDAVKRETLEEAGIHVDPEEVLRVEHEVVGLPRLRFVVAARPRTFRTKAIADHHSMEARWLRLEEIARLPLRHAEVLTHLEGYRRRFGAAPWDRTLVD